MNNYILNLDNLDESEIKYETITFPGGEPHVKLDLNTISEGSSVDVYKLIRNSDEFISLCMILNALKQAGMHDINLFIPYFPGARQDRVSHRGEALSVKVYANILNQFNLTSVTVTNPHSDVTTALLDNCYVEMDFDQLAKFIDDNEIGYNDSDNDNEEFILISPDAGALKKTYMLAKYFSDEYDFNFDIVECSKTRNTQTGKLSGFKVNTVDLKGRPCIIYDDICDGGGTFLGLATKLKEMGAGDLYLYVTHGIFSNNAQNRLLEVFKNIGSTYEF